MEDVASLTIPISFDHSIDNCPASAQELELIAALLPELLKEMLSHPETEGD